MEGEARLVSTEPATLDDAQALADSCYRHMQDPPDWAIAILAAHPPVISGSDPDPDAARRNRRVHTNARRGKKGQFR